MDGDVLTRRARRLLFRSAPILLIAAATAGCGKDKVTDPIGVPWPPPPHTPQQTLWALRFAWDQRDSARTRGLYDDDYTGTSQDPDGGPSRTFTKDQEVAVVWALGKDSQVRGTSMDLGPEDGWGRVHRANDPEGWATILVPAGASLQVETAAMIYRASTSSHEFTFKPYATGADTTWKLVRWTETIPALPDARASLIP